MYLGVAGVGQAFTQEICEQMMENTPRPVIFALSNPTSHAECTAEQAYYWTDVRIPSFSGYTSIYPLMSGQALLLYYYFLVQQNIM